MKTPNKTLTLLAILLLTLSCSEKKMPPPTLEFSKTIKIPLEVDINLSNRMNAEYYNWGYENTIAVYSNVDMAMHIYSLDSLKEIEKIDLSNLPNGKAVRAFKFINKDTFLVSTQLSDQYYFVNKSGEVLKSFRITIPKFIVHPQFAYGNFNDGANSNPILFDSDKNLLVYHSYFAPYPYLQKQSKLFLLELENKNSLNIVEKNVFSFNDFYDTTKIWAGETTPIGCEIGDNFILGSYNKADLIMINPKTGELSVIHSPESTFLKDYDELDTMRLNDAEYTTIYQFYQSGYRAISYDPFNELIYRIVSLPMEDSTVYTTPYINTSALKPFSIMIYDKDFTLLNEIRFPAHKYDQNNLIVTSEGILLDIANDGNKEFSTSILQYDLFKIVK